MYAISLSYQVHTAGLTSDLPEHLSTQDDVDGLIESLKRALRGVTAPPSLVTIARCVLVLL